MVIPQSPLQNVEMEVLQGFLRLEKQESRIIPRHDVCEIVQEPVIPIEFMMKSVKDAVTWALLTSHPHI